MTTIQLRGTDTAFMQTLHTQLAQDLAKAGLNNDLATQAPQTHTEFAVRGVDPMTWTQVALVAVGAGGALTALLGKDGFLTALARVLEKYLETRQIEVVVETKDGEKIQVTGPVGHIKDILKQIKD